MDRLKVTFRIAMMTLAAGCLCACAHQPQTATTPEKDCHTESGWLDSSDGCSIRAGYPNCYLVCADGSRRKL